jgi:flagellar protein FlaJ
MSMSITGIAHNLFGSVAEKYSPTFIFLKDSLMKADIKIPFIAYLSTVFFLSSITFFASLIATIIFLALNIVEIPFLLKVVCTIFVPIVTSIACFVILLFYPVRKVSARRKNIEVNVPFVLTHMAAIAESGVPPYVMFKLISECKEYGELAKEMEKIVRNIEVFGMDPLSAIKEVAKRCPSESLTQVLNGIVTTTESGGNLKLYLKTTGEQALFEWQAKRKRFAEQLSAYAEFYTGILIAAPLFIIALFSVMSTIQPTLAGYSILELTKFSVYGLIPLLNIIFLVFLKGVEVEI